MRPSAILTYALMSISQLLSRRRPSISSRNPTGTLPKGDPANSDSPSRLASPIILSIAACARATTGWSQIPCALMRDVGSARIICLINPTSSLLSSCRSTCEKSSLLNRCQASPLWTRSVNRHRISLSSGLIPFWTVQTQWTLTDQGQQCSTPSPRSSSQGYIQSLGEETTQTIHSGMLT